MNTTPAPSTTFRDMVYSISPSWLRGWVGSRFMYAMAIQFDAIADSVAYAVLSRFPSYAPPDAFQYLANDRQIEPGFQEPQPSYVVRLRQWLDRHAKRGSPWGVLMAVRGFVAPDLPQVSTIGNNGVWDTYFEGDPADPSNAPVHAFGEGVEWDWDSLSYPHLDVPAAGRVAWWRVWVVIYAEASPWSQTAAKFGDGVTRWGDGSSYGWTGTPAQLVALQALIRKWKAANTWVPNIIIAFDLAFIHSTLAVLPAGTYGVWSKVITASNGRPQYVPSRYGNAAYLDGVT